MERMEEGKRRWMRNGEDGRGWRERMKRGWKENGKGMRNG